MFCFGFFFYCNCVYGGNCKRYKLNFNLGELNMFILLVVGFNSINVRLLGVLDVNGGFFCDVIVIGDEVDVDLDLVL